MEFGREAMGTKGLPVYVLPKMKSFLESNGPWSQLVSLKNITLREMQADVPVGLSDDIIILPFQVPHRDEFSETAGFKIVTPSRRYLFIPDIDKWSKFEKDIVEEVEKVDVAFLDASFYTAQELPGRDLREIPHPLVTETMKLFKSSSQSTKSKVHFIHFNHSNPLISDTVAQESVTSDGFNLARQGATY
jgi:pyrroloquinoline quinone biosynthesis protein B